jgi:hypothetical protein
MSTFSKVLFVIGCVVSLVCLITDGPAFYAGITLIVAGMVGIAISNEA